ncbi:MAG: ABC transporter permease [Pirellulales bacterium]
MLLGPVFSAEVVTSARRARYFVLRTAYALILLLLLWSTYETARLTSSSLDLNIRQTAELTASFFSSFAYLQLVTVLLVGPAIAAGTIAEERQRRTIEYLFATDLSNREIILDKLAGRLLLITYLIVVGLPILATFRLLGGISLNVLLLLFVVTTSTMLAVSAVSVSLSVWSTKARDAVLRTYLVLFAVLLLPLVIRGWLAVGPSGKLASGLGQLVEWLMIVNPLLVLGQGLNRTAATGSVWEPVGWMVLAHASAAALSIAGATVAVRRVHLRAAGNSSRRRWRLPVRRWRPQLGNHPMLWKELFARHSVMRLGLAGWIASLLILLATAMTTAWVFIESLESNGSSRRPPFDNAYFQYSVSAGAFVACGALLLIAMRAAGAIAGEKERDCWLSLVGTPLSARQIVFAKVAGNVYALRWILVVPVSIWALQVVLWFPYLLLLPVLIGLLLLLALFMSSMGVLYSFLCRTTLRAMGATLATSIFLGGGYFLLCCLPLMITGPGRGSEFVLAPCVPFLLVIPNLIFVDFFDEFLGDDRYGMLAAFFLGVVGYSVGTAMLNASMLANFDRWAGRIHGPRTGTPDPCPLVDATDSLTG